MCSIYTILIPIELGKRFPEKLSPISRLVIEAVHCLHLNGCICHVNIQTDLGKLILNGFTLPTRDDMVVQRAYKEFPC